MPNSQLRQDSTPAPKAAPPEWSPGCVFLGVKVGKGRTLMQPAISSWSLSFKVLSLLFPHLNSVRKFISGMRRYPVGGIEKRFRVLSIVRGLSGKGNILKNWLKFHLKLTWDAWRSWRRREAGRRVSSMWSSCQWAKEGWGDGAHSFTKSQKVQVLGV